ncbi:MAG: hypothetical protein H0X39_06415 [Actinobacteria bacterium]|nr:hypothetical protein [Actinomycetota bacterium]
MTPRTARQLLGLLIAITCITVPSAAFATPSATKSVQIWVTPDKGDTPYGKVLFTGAIGDYGKTINTDKNGKVDSNGDYVKVVLKKGTFVVDATAIAKRFAHLAPKVDSSTCSAIISVTHVPITISGGTGSYAAIAGKGNLNFVFAGLATRYKAGAKKGQCNLSGNGPTTASFSTITGSMSVSL